MAPGHVPDWEKLQEIGPSGRFLFLGDASVRLVGPTVTQIVRDVASNVRYGSVGDVIVGPADASGWKAIRPGDYSWAWQLRRRAGSDATTQGIIAILIGLVVFPPAELHALKLLRPYLAPGARLHLAAGHKFTLESHVPTSFNGYDAGFTGGVFVAT